MADPSIRLPSLLRRWWLPLLLATVGGALVSWAIGSWVSPTYDASAQVLVETPTAAGGTRQAAALTPTYAEMVRSTPVLAYALRSTHVPVSLDRLRQRVRGESNQDTRLVTVRADAPTGREAVALANALSAGLRWYVSTAAVSSTSGTPPTAPPRVRLVDPAKSAARVRPRPALSLAFGAAAGLFAAFAFAFIAEARKPRVSDEDALSALGNLPVLASVNGGLPPHGRGSLGPNENGTEEAASYRRLATQIAVANSAQEPPSLLVLGAEDDESSALVASKLALTLAHDGRRVVLADFGGGDRVGRLFGLGEPGTRGKMVKRSTPLECRDVTLDRYALRSGVPFVLALPRRTQGALSSETAEELLGWLSADADILVLHGPPPSRSRGALTWARTARATVLVVRAEHTSRTHVEAALAGLEPAGANLLGAVLQTGPV